MLEFQIRMKVPKDKQLRKRIADLEKKLIVSQEKTTFYVPLFDCLPLLNLSEFYTSKSNSY